MGVCSVEGSLRIAVRLGKFKIPIQDQRPLPAQLQVGLRINAAPQDPAVASAAISNAGVRGHRRSVRSLSGDAGWVRRRPASRHLRASADPPLCESSVETQLQLRTHRRRIPRCSDKFPGCDVYPSTPPAARYNKLPELFGPTSALAPRT